MPRANNGFKDDWQLKMLVFFNLDPLFTCFEMSMVHTYQKFWKMVQQMDIQH